MEQTYGLCPSSGEKDMTVGFPETSTPSPPLANYHPAWNSFYHLSVTNALLWIGLSNSQKNWQKKGKGIWDPSHPGGPRVLGHTCVYKCICTHTFIHIIFSYNLSNYYANYSKPWCKTTIYHAHKFIGSGITARVGKLFSALWWWALSWRTQKLGIGVTQSLIHSYPWQLMVAEAKILAGC